ncbi:succinylglutamate-semialdehyde dehydrogenase [Amphritea balenae]|uniref:N-succinylglutamate 5-semialdehyde dehydrogenase n=1 Tax=Amphritea balenae TaxID=452629 RepID=A0A3P1SPC8_9GAMM|nr:succinylglutamate-semialdehyde dehydrogenase [Amphritea balenae]RRC98977.1 succinylglutamate-semialdehyde dehydrogenase [Amphritea balenae]GGK63351.1 N-succinylglutamate 5-semialdehyde dehydrogenase [Amphritea balenae]
MNSVASLFIDGSWIQGSGQPFASVNPASDERIWQGYAASDQQVDQAVNAARSAAERWSQMAVEQRQGYIKRFTGLISEYSELLADTIGQETGKPLWESRTEVSAMLAKTDISIKAQQERSGNSIQHSSNGDLVLRHKPHGVVAIFGPYNFPAHLPNGHIIPALLAGNTIVFKPSELTPRCGELLLHLWQKAELPDGVLNLVQGAADTGKALASHVDIDGLFFTGSASTGQLLHQQFGGHPEKILALEMGGNNPLIITPLQNLRAALHDTIMSAFLSAGQRCTCARRLLIPDNHWGDDFIDQLVQATAKIRTGFYNAEPQPFMGALINQSAAQSILSAQQELQDAGASILLESTVQHNTSTLLSPSIVDISALSDAADTEYFGPLLQVIRYRHFDTAISIANNTQYGLSAGLFSDSPEQYEQFQRQIRAGIINWNRPLTGASSGLPFGGCGISGNHRPSAYYATDYCAYPVASMESRQPIMPTQLSPGLEL